MSCDWSDQFETESSTGTVNKEVFQEKHQGDSFISNRQLTSTPIRCASISDGFSVTENEEVSGLSFCSSIPGLATQKETEEGMPADLDSMHSDGSLDKRNLIDGFSEIGSGKSVDDWDSEADRSYLKQLDVESASGCIAESLCRILALCPDKDVLLQAMNLAKASTMAEFAKNVQEKLDFFMAGNQIRLAKQSSKSSLCRRLVVDRAKAIRSSDSPSINDEACEEASPKNLFQDIHSNDSSFGDIETSF